MRVGTWMNCTRLGGPTVAASRRFDVDDTVGTEHGGYRRGNHGQVFLWHTSTTAGCKAGAGLAGASAS